MHYDSLSIYFSLTLTRSKFYLQSNGVLGSEQVDLNAGVLDPFYRIEFFLDYLRHKPNGDEKRFKL